MAYNRGIMAALHFLVPDALVASDFAPELLRDLRLPHLDQIAALAVDEPAACTHPTLLAPWQDWLLQGATRPNLAVLAALATDTTVPDHADGSPTGCWLVQPAHCAIALDHLILTDPDRLELDAQEATALAAVATPLLQGAGWRLTVATPHTWLLTRHGDATPSDLCGPAVACAHNGNVGPWLPFDSGSGASLQWQRIATEVQMTWHTHAVNQAREAAGKPLVNFLWLTGTGTPDIRGARLEQYARIDAELPFLARHGPLPGHATHAPDAPNLTVWHGLTEAARAEDWSLWRNQIRALDARLGKVLDALRNKRLDPLLLVLTGPSSLRVLRVARGDLWKFWRRGNAVGLIADAP